MLFIFNISLCDSTHSELRSGTELSVEEDIEENISGVVDDLLSNEGISEVKDHSQFALLS